MLEYPYRESSSLCKWCKNLMFLLVSILLKMQSYFGGGKNVTVQVFLPQAVSEARGQIQSNEVNGITLNLLLYK